MTTRNTQVLLHKILRANVFIHVKKETLPRNPSRESVIETLDEEACVVHAAFSRQRTRVGALTAVKIVWLLPVFNLGGTGAQL